ncbi:MAG: tyrosine-type recombinase/integrase, partial [Nitrospina sp.]|nr:tyrosine-type recombinase/integrase [Nitrospina sp.]
MNELSVKKMLNKNLNNQQGVGMVKSPCWKIRDVQAPNSEENMPELIFPRGKRGIFHANCRHMGERIQRSLGTTDRRLAERRLAELKTLVERGEYQAYKKKFEDLAKQYMDQELPQKSNHSQERYGQIIRTHLLPFFKGKTLTDINDQLVVEFKLHRETAGAKPSTLKKELRVLKDTIRLAKREFQLPTVKNYPLMKWANKPKQFDKSMILEESDMLDIKSCVLKEYQNVFLIGMYSGLRLSDVVSLCPKEVDLKEGTIGKYQGKTTNWVEIPICKKLKKVLDSLVRPLDKSQSFFPGVGTKAVTTNVLRACKKAGFERHSFKSSRHFTATQLTNKGVPIEVVKEWMGHQSINTTMIYSKVKKETLKKAATAFDENEVS